MNVLVSAPSKGDLLSRLREVDISVPGRECARSHEQKERWVICRLLSSLAHAGCLTYPLGVETATPPNPDFLVSIDEMRIGVEVTEATSPQWSQFLDYVARAPDKPALIEPASFRPGAWKRARNRAERIEMMGAEANKGRLTSPGWSGNEAEQDWAGYIADAANRKLQSTHKYRANCHKLWLAVYENAPLPYTSYDQALELLRPKLTNFWRAELGFDTLYIDGGESIVCVERDAHKIIAVNNLWRSPSGLTSNRKG